jgi:hypothetical protein
MRITLFALAPLLLAALVASCARAQASVPYRRPVEPPSGSYARVDVSFSGSQSSGRLGRTSLQLQTSVNVPDGCDVLAGGYSSVHAGRNEFGTPGLGKTPILNRGTNNVGYGRSVRKSTVSVRVRVIRMAEEEERQTGVRP